MYKLTTSEIFNLISAMEDSILLAWKSQSESDDPHRHPGWKDLPPLYDRQKTLQIWLMWADFPELMKPFAEIMNECVEDEAQK